MTHSSDESLKSSLRRGEILWVLKDEYPHLMMVPHLRRELAERLLHIPSKELFQYLAYLDEAGLLRREWGNKNPETDNPLAVGLTKNGVLLCEGCANDEGVLA